VHLADLSILELALVLSALAIAGLLGLVAVLALRARRLGRLHSTASRGRNAAAQDGERRAERVLRRAGFAVVERQVAGRLSLSIDGERVEVTNRADLIVRRGRRTYVAEVKTGAIAPDPTHPATRRQLLEYRLAFDVDGVLLVDMEREAVHEIGFPDVEWS
jgi:Holliday junction resolvase-like predicted endonuclease